jgi:hypothetical protein
MMKVEHEYVIRITPSCGCRPGNRFLQQSRWFFCHRARFSLNMLDESTLGMPFLAGFLLLVSLFFAWYSRVDPLVSFHLALLQSHMPQSRGLYPFNFPSSMLFQQ